MAKIFKNTPLPSLPKHKEAKVKSQIAIDRLQNKILKLENKVLKLENKTLRQAKELHRLELENAELRKKQGPLEIIFQEPHGASHKSDVEVEE